MENPPSALPRRVRELNPSLRNAPQDRPSSRDRIRKKSKRHSKSATRDKAQKRRHDEEDIVHKASSDEFFRRELSIFTALRSIPELQRNVPQLVSANPSTRTYIARRPNIIFRPLYEQAKQASIGVIRVDQLKCTLQRYIHLLYEHGVGYRISPRFIFLARLKGFPGWRILLGALEGSDFCEVSKRTEPAWDAQKEEQYIEIDRMFAPIEALAIQRDADLTIKEAAEFTEEADAKLRDANAAMEKVDATVKEANAKFREASATMKKAYASMLEAYAMMKGANAPMKEAEDARKDAHYVKVHALCSTREAIFHREEAVVKEADALRQLNGDEAMEEADACKLEGDATMAEADSATGG